MILGAHVSTAGGLHKSPGNGLGLGCQSIQIFTRNQRQWKAKPLTDSEVEGFRQELSRSGIRSTAAHASYLLNLGSPEPAVLARSREAFCRELERCQRLELDFLVVHPGAHLGSGESAGLRVVAASLNQALEQHRDLRTRILLETTAGQGSHLGYRFEHLAEILSLVQEPERAGVCVDTCHIFAAGYDLRDGAGYHRTLDQLDRILGLIRVQAFHLNDSKRELGSRVDRHEHIGEGRIGAEGFRLLVNDRRFAHTPMILETPGGETHYGKNLSRLRQMHG